MKCLLPVVLLCACQTRRVVTLPNGTHYEDFGHLAGTTTVAIKPDGTVVMHNKMSESWKDLMQLIGSAVVASEGADVAIAGIASSRAKTLGAQRAATARAASAADLERLKLLQDFEKFRLTLPTQLPVTP